MTTSRHLWLPLLRLIRDVFSSCPLDARPLVVQREVGLGQHGTVLLLFRRRALRLQPLVNPVAIERRRRIRRSEVKYAAHSLTRDTCQLRCRAGRWGESACCPPHQPWTPQWCRSIPHLHDTYQQQTNKENKDMTCNVRIIEASKEMGRTYLDGHGRSGGGHLRGRHGVAADRQIACMQ
jgi:hypothetical protein